MKEYFRVNVSRYVTGKDFDVVRPASLNNPKDNAVMFISAGYMDHVDAFKKCRDCLIFWPAEEAVPDDLAELHAVCVVENTRNGYCGFFRDSLSNINGTGIKIDNAAVFIGLLDTI